jgi:hypothetical protein
MPDVAMIIQTTCTGARGNRETGAVFEGETDEEGTSLSNILGENVQHKLLDIVEDTTAFFDGGEDGCEIVVGKYNV